jgi:hypothetical protein
MLVPVRSNTRWALIPCETDKVLCSFGIARSRGSFASSSRKMVPHLMAGRTKCNQVVQGIVAELTPLRQMMYLQIFR